jgi:hypothetical protein
MPEIHPGRALVVALLWLLAAAVGGEQDSKARVTGHNVGRVYHPSVLSASATYKKIGVVTSRTVFDATPEYRQIARRKLTPNTAEWCFLAKAASDKFRTAIAKTQKGGGYDMIAENGAVTVDGQTTFDVTSEVLAHLPTE